MPVQAAGAPYSLLRHQAGLSAELQEEAKAVSLCSVMEGSPGRDSLSVCEPPSLRALLPSAPTPPGPECNWQLRSVPKASINSRSAS